MDTFLKKIISLWRILTALRSAFNILVVFIIALITLLFFFLTGNLGSMWLPILILFSIVGFVIGVNIIGLNIGLSQKPQEGKQGKNPFVGSLSFKVETKRDFNKTQLSPEETVLGWLAPVDGTNFNRANYAIGKEFVVAAENVLILTNKQLIGLALVQEDLNQIKTNSLISVIQSANTINPSASNKQFWTTTANLNVFPKFMEKLNETTLKKLLSTRWQFGINLDQIKTIEPRKTFFNPGVWIHLNDGRIYKYKVIWKEQINQFVEAVKKTSVNLCSS